MGCLTPKLNEIVPCDVTVVTLSEVPCEVATLTQGIGTLIFNDGQGGISIVDSDEVETALYNEVSNILTLTKLSGEIISVEIPQVDTYITNAVYSEVSQSIIITRSDGVTYEVAMTSCCGTGVAAHAHTQPTLVFNTNGTMTFTDGDGTATILPNDDVISGAYNAVAGELTLTKRSTDTVVIDFSGLASTLPAKRFTQVIPAGTSSITITHSLPTNFPMVQLLDANGSIVDYTLTATTSNGFQLDFNPATVGITNLVVI